jgi:hypothetical protein
VSRAPLPEVRNSHLAGVLERERAARELKRIARKKAKRLKRHVARQRQRESKDMNKQTLPTTEQQYPKKRKTPDRKSMFLAPAVTERLVQIATAPGGKMRLIDLYGNYAPSKSKGHGPGSAVSTLLRKHQLNEPWPMSGETHRIWMAIYDGSPTPNMPPLPNAESAPEPAALLDRKALLRDMQDMVDAAVANAIGATRAPKTDYAVEIKALVGPYVKRRYGTSFPAAYRAAYSDLYATYQSKGFALPEVDGDDTLLRRIIGDGHGADLLAIAHSLFGVA